MPARMASQRLSPWRWLMFAGLFGRCIMQNLTHGQLGLWVACLLLRGATRLQARRDLAAGGCFAVAAALKLTPLLFVLALPCMGRWRAGLMTALGTAVLVLLVPWPFLGTAEHSRHLHDFYRAMIAPQFGVGDSPVLAYHPGPSVAGTFDYLLQARPLDAEGYRVNLVDLPDTAVRVIKLLWSLLLAALLGSTFLRARALPQARRVSVQVAMTMLAMALFSPLTRVYHLAMALLPAALFCHGPRRRDFAWWFAAAVFALTLPLRQRHLLGEPLWRWFDNGGLLHFGLVALLLWSWSWTAQRGRDAPAAVPPAEGSTLSRSAPPPVR